MSLCPESSLGIGVQHGWKYLVHKGGAQQIGKAIAHAPRWAWEMLHVPAPLCLSAPIQQVRKNTGPSPWLICSRLLLTPTPSNQTFTVLPHSRLECWILEVPPVSRCSGISSSTAGPVTALGIADFWAWGLWHRPSLDFTLTVPSSWSNSFPEQMPSTARPRTSPSYCLPYPVSYLILPAPSAPDLPSFVYWDTTYLSSIVFCLPTRIQAPQRWGLHLGHVVLFPTAEIEAQGVY